MRWLDECHWLKHEFEQTLGSSGGEGSLASCSPWGCKEWDTPSRPNDCSPWSVCCGRICPRQPSRVRGMSPGVLWGKMLFSDLRLPVPPGSHLRTRPFSQTLSRPPAHQAQTSPERAAWLWEAEGLAGVRPARPRPPWAGLWLGTLGPVLCLALPSSKWPSLLPSGLISSLPVSGLCMVTQACLMLCDPMDCSPPGSSVHGDFPGQNTAVGCHFLLQGIFSTQGWNPGLLHWQADSSPGFHLGSPSQPLVIKRSFTVSCPLG